ncbi:hypothetical protein AAZX31_15G129900 [Glycine max]|uniref:Uncharacterized protein n=2 Tax=Glycine subgen. Soja TaxID=1462606 RepID=K7MB70_SOYBN|nr:uncharacterized protein LOC100805847 [Glycine max]XP_028202813.1 uncharacterized protein LOC114386938 [Glycine soja]KAG4381378.1 hypothetical protein GLYMA_15G135900v4 [Glycine max]KAG4946178.1 hypothetical protein JHK87_042185 [Glycine soja]KAH1147019.1 hypothetical protein GYH30_042272 [Glycine max]KAH1147020.1 hypothetical protein GYH30_042272 [Glycine max]KAH1147021.1 hypothetical protein GYH30_042272 [Glycine max]|eukprot:XP_025981665.1 uncharacterized protein LOC100805847 [Glycine max]
MVVEALSLVQGCSISMKELQLSLIPVSPNLTQQSHPFLLVLVMAIVLFNGKDDGSDTGRERENRGRGGFDRGRGRGRGSEKGKGKVREKDVDEKVMDTDDFATGLYKGEDADGEKLARKIGPEIMNQLTEGFEEMTSRILPLALEDEFLDALDINYAIEFEPEYLVEFDNPDIDEKEPIPLRDALEKAKPFLMSYEGIQSQEEWEKIMEETMVNGASSIVEKDC